jgi:hypothetical protein
VLQWKQLLGIDHQIVSSGTINPGTAEFLINNVSKFSSYLTGSTLCLRYKDQPDNVVKG